MKLTNTNRLVLEGVLLPTGWDPSGRVVDVTLMTFDETDYPVARPAARAHNLPGLLRRSVRLSVEVRDGRVIRIIEVMLLRA